MSNNKGILQITDGTITIDLRTGGFRLVNWTPSIAQPKGSGVWNDSMLDDNRRPVMFKRGNATELFSLKVVTNHQDDTIRETQELRRLLEKAQDFWTTEWQNEPVWLVARGKCETNTRYAYIVNYTAARDDDPYQSPFGGPVLATMDQFDLEIERMDWMSCLPGEGDCVELASQQVYLDDTDDGDYLPTESGDDCLVDMNTGACAIAEPGGVIYIGNAAGAYEAACGIRFRNVTIPVGATILNAWIDVVATNDDSGGVLHLKIYGDLDTTPAIFSTYANFVGRTKTTAVYNRGITESWTAAATYELLPDKPDAAAIVQEIIDAPGWASGNDMAFLVYDNGSNDYRRFASWDHAALTEPTLYVVWYTSDANVGRSATCLAEVFFANKHNEAQITNIWQYDAAPVTWVDVKAAALPANIFPAVPAAGDIVYFGCDSTLANSGPFSSLVFDIGAAGNDILAVNWYYWNGAWVALTVRTTIDTLPEYFNVAGVGSVSFDQPDDWATNAVNGVTGFWVKAEIPAGGVGAAPTTPTQANRQIYTVVRPSVDIDEQQIPGDITALARALVYNESIQGEHSVILATRSTARGLNFRMFTNLADEQNQPGITIAPDGVTAVFADCLDSPTGRAVLYNPGAGNSGDCEITIDGSIAGDFIGRYRCYVRVDMDGAVTDCTMTLNIGLRDIGGITIVDYFESETITVPSDDAGLLIDFGVIDIPGMGVVRDNEVFSDFVLTLNLANTTAAPQLYLYDLILIPIDEWAGEFNSITTITTDATIGGIDQSSYKYLDVDCLSQKRNISSFVRTYPGDVIQYAWKNIASEPMQLQANTDQRVYIFTRRWENLDEVWLADVSGMGKITVDATARYLGMRGDR
jgi:hypothetical protein